MSKTDYEQSLTIQDMVQALSQLPASAPEFPAVTLEELGGQVLQELARRLGDPLLRQELPATGLFQLANAVLKVQQDRINMKAGEVKEQRGVLEVIRESELPDERKIELLKAEAGRIEGQYLHVMKYLEALNAGKEVPEHQETEGV